MRAINRMWTVVFVAAVCGWLWASSTPAMAQANDKEHQSAGQGDTVGHSGEDTHAAPNPLGFDPDLAIATAIIFLVLLGFLWFFAWTPISEALRGASTLSPRTSPRRSAWPRTPR